MFGPRTRLSAAALVLFVLAGCARELPNQPAASSAPAPTSPRDRAGEPGAIVAGEYVVVLRADASSAGAARNRRLAQSLAQAARLTPRHTYGAALAGFAARMTDAQAAQLAADPSVASVEPDRYVRATAQSVPAGLGLVNAPIAHTRGWRGAGIKVGVIDTGIDYTHPDLAANYVSGVDFVNDDEDPMDDNGHGTHVSGTIAAVDNAEGVLGVAPAARLYGIKVLDAGGSGSWADVIAGIDWAAANGMQVVNLSLGAPVGMTALQTAVDNAYRAGVVICAAAGNSGGAVGYPGAYASTICVSAVGANKVIASFSSRGSEVDVTAPGVAVSSTWPRGQYASLQGTSMATPHVAGVAALVWSTGRYRTAATVRDRVIATCGDLGTAGVDPLYGKGLVNADAATAPPPNVLPVAKAGGPYTAYVNANVSFSSAGSTDADGRIVSYAWVFGDGATSTAANPTHAYARTGTFAAKLTVTDDRGGKTTASATVTIKALPVDVVAILGADYVRSTKLLTVVASSNVPGVTMTLTGYGTMTYDTNSAHWIWTRVATSMPATVKVTSSRGGAASKAVRGI